ncbi:transaldolase [Pediococcus pentosaceus]|uniref:transaldolase n=1 Tax=Pediococcus pentosaceus TaxID=1255 RepID=UPI00237F4895|nr:transaldolase [Pediococcus pentosaceus]MDE3750825.1 transaldolase [Pediococcus pentosaceus]
MSDLFNIDIYADGAVIKDMIKAKNELNVKGFTTNPSLMKKAGITDYMKFAKEVLNNIEGMPISFEVFSDDFNTMKMEALKLSELGKNVFVKIPITNTRGESSVPLIKELSALGVAINVTAILTVQQVKEVVPAFSDGTSNIVSVFAGRVADTGVDPTELMRESVELIKNSKGDTKLLWASCREVLNIKQAADLGVDIITVTTPVLNKLSMVGEDLQKLSLETVKGFNADVKDLGFSIV